MANAGAKVCLLEAGGYYDPKDPKYITQLKNPWESPRRGASVTRPFGDFDAAWGGWNIEGEPYSAKEGTEFHWFRSRMLGGRTNHWGRISLRFGPDDFKRGSISGVDTSKIFPQIGRDESVEGLINIPDSFFDKVEAVVVEGLRQQYWDEFLVSEQHTKLLNFLWYQDRTVVPEDFFVMRVLGRGGFGLVTGK